MLISRLRLLLLVWILLLLLRSSCSKSSRIAARLEGPGTLSTKKPSHSIEHGREWILATVDILREGPVESGVTFPFFWCGPARRPLFICWALVSIRHVDIERTRNFGFFSIRRECRSVKIPVDVAEVYGVSSSLVSGKVTRPLPLR